MRLLVSPAIYYVTNRPLETVILRYRVFVLVLGADGTARYAK